MSDRNVRVIKLGGSLLDASEWPDAFRRWLARQPPMPNVLIVGGGALAEAIRRWDQIHRLTPRDAHGMAIGTMSLTARLAGKLLPEVAWTDEWSTVFDFVGHVDRSQSLLIFDPSRFLETIEPALDGEPLSQSWDVTSDSIAARIARLLGCRELVLLKSCPPPPETTALERLADFQYVDREFPRFARDLPQVRFVNLREEFRSVGFSPRAIER
jgi:5-(aminomethyl)-3-furanmethanol phosphate kinase